MSENHWTVDKRVNLSHLGATALVAVTVLAFVLRMESAVKTNTENIAEEKAARQRAMASLVDQHRTDMIRLEQGQLAQYTEIIRRLERIADKLDNKADKALP